MDPYVWTLIKQSITLGAAAAIVVGLGYFLVQYSKLQYALTLNMTPPQVP